MNCHYIHTNQGGLGDTERRGQTMVPTDGLTKFPDPLQPDCKENTHVLNKMLQHIIMDTKFLHSTVLHWPLVAIANDHYMHKKVQWLLTIVNC